MQEFKAAFQMFSGGKEALNVENLDKALKKFGAPLCLLAPLWSPPLLGCPWPFSLISPCQASRTLMPRT
jgi:hypothetical protein